MSVEHLEHQDAILKLKELSERARICMFCTQLEKKPFDARPMALQETDEEGNLWFISPADSDKNFDILKEGEAQLLFMNNLDAEYLSVYGTASIYSDKNTIEEKWSVMANTWFHGKDELNVTIIKVCPKESYYWDVKAGKLVSMLHYVSAVVSGKPSDGE